MRDIECRADLPDRFFGDVYRRICTSYETAHDMLAHQFDVEGHCLPEFRNTLPWLRRGLVEQALMVSALSFPSELSVSCESSGGFWHHRRIVGGRTQLTQSTHGDVGKPLRRARYKEEYAYQQMLFDTEDTTLEAHTYAVLLHHGSWQATRPDFVVIKFPKTDLSWHPEVIDLSAEFSNTQVDETVPIEEVADDAIPTLRRRRNVVG